MARPTNTSIRRSLVVFGVVLLIAIGGTSIVVKAMADHFLYRNATQIAERWAGYLAANVTDLEQIAAGEAPSSASLTSPPPPNW